jgi:GNAT superfamily N-acetyltransferase
MRGLRHLAPADLPRLQRFWIEHWAGDEMIVHGEVFRPEQLQGFVTEDWDGVVTYCIRSGECEIISLDSLREGRGIGTALINAVIAEAREGGCSRVVLSTTNDNLRALGFYQRRGFALAQIRPGAMDESRKLKPGIPTIGMDGIPLRDEVQLELKLCGSPRIASGRHR